MENNEKIRLAFNAVTGLLYNLDLSLEEASEILARIEVNLRKGDIDTDLIGSWDFDLISTK